VRYANICRFRRLNDVAQRIDVTVHACPQGYISKEVPVPAMLDPKANR
jgi:hypothetical protein